MVIICGILIMYDEPRIFKVSIENKTQNTKWSQEMAKKKIPCYNCRGRKRLNIYWIC